MGKLKEIGIFVKRKKDKEMTVILKNSYYILES
jgi:hypothetical protein